MNDPQHVGEWAALATALSWTIAVLAFEAAGRRIGAMSVNLIRLAIGCGFLAVYGWIWRGLPFPTDASLHNWIWLSLSGLIGLTVGDLCLFRAFIIVGGRIAILIMAFVPVLSAVISWLFLGEILSSTDMIGMVLTVGGVVMVLLRRAESRIGWKAGYPLSGLLLAFGGAIGQAVGLVLSKHGMVEYDAFAANHIRLIAGLAGFCVLSFFLRWWSNVGRALTDRRGMLHTTVGSFFGTFLGISLSLYAVQHTQVGVAATIIALVPIFIIAPSVVVNKEKVTPRDLLGSVIAVSGSALLFL